MNQQSPLLEVRNLYKRFPVLRGVFRREVGSVHAVNGVSFELNAQETIGIVGESGCGKSTLGKTLIRLYQPEEGEVLFRGQNLANVHGKKLRHLRKNMQMIFQDPLSSLNARMTVRDIIAEPFVIHKISMSREEMDQKIDVLLSTVGISKSAKYRYPHEFSGGQCQRIGIARALALNPQLLICDEAVSALDVSVQSQIINLLLSLQQEFQLSYIFISHDLTVVRHVSDKVLVMYLGEIMELASSTAIYSHALHPYTQALISAIPQLNPSQEHKKISLKGEIPSPVNLPSGCKFHPRCPYAQDRCKQELPSLRLVDKKFTAESDVSSHYVACHFAEDLQTSASAYSAEYKT